MATVESPAFGTATVNGHTVKTTTTTSTLSGATDTIVTPVIASNTSTIENKKIIMGMDVKVAFSDVTTALSLEASHDGSNWTTISTLLADTTPNVTGVKTQIADLTDVYAPYFRLHFNSKGHSVGTSGTCQFFYTYTA